MAKAQDPKRSSCIEELERRLLMSRPLGLDTSHYQGTINWTSVASSGRVFGETKATEGTDYTDPLFATDISGANNAGVHMGGYHFARYDLNPGTAGAQAEAQYYLSVAGSQLKTGYMPPMLDVEHSESYDKPTLSAWINSFCNYILQQTGLQTLIYTGISFSNNNLNTSVTGWPLWIANWNGADPQTGQPSGTGPWSSWQFWQYSDVGSVPGVTGNCDVDTFNGTPTQLQTWYIPAAPSAPSPSNNGIVTTATPTLNWADATWAMSYDVYVDNVFKANVTTSQWTATSPLNPGNHTWKVVAKNNATGSSGGIAGGNWNFNVTLSKPGVPSNPTPANGAILNTTVYKYDWDDTPGATSYVVYFGTDGTSVTTTQSQLSVAPSDGVQLWQVKAVNPAGETLGPQWQYTMDRFAPTASYGGETPAAGSNTMDFTVTYTDATSGVDVSTLDDSDVTVTGPNGFSANATLVSTDVAGNGSPRTATYRIGAPGGTWTEADNGTYAVTLNANQVNDVAGNEMAGGQLATFDADLSFAYMQGSQLRVEFDGGGAPIEIAPGDSEINVTRGATTLNFTNVTSISVTGSSGSDSLAVGAIPVAFAFAGNGGDDAITIESGTFTFAQDLNTLNPGGTISVHATSGGNVIFSSTQHIKAVIVDDGSTVTMSAGGGYYLDVQTLTIAPNGKLDLNDNDLVVNNGDFSTIQGLVFAGYRQGADSGATGIISSTGQTTAGNPILALLNNALIGSPDYPFGSGQTISANAIIGKYTYFGDTNLDGQVTADDYGALDANFGATGVNPGIAWIEGDTNFDGSVTADDYGTLDANFGQGVGNPLAPNGTPALALDDPARLDLLS